MGQTVLTMKYSSIDYPQPELFFGYQAPHQWYLSGSSYYDFETFTCAQCADCSNMLQVRFSSAPFLILLLIYICLQTTTNGIE